MDKELLVFFMLRNVLKQEIDMFFDDILEHSVINISDNTDPEMLFHAICAVAKKTSQPILHDFMKSISGSKEDQDFEQACDSLDYSVN
jgi:hypothetical protein